MVEAAGSFITAVPGQGQEEAPNQQMVAMRDTDDLLDDEQFSQDEDEREENQYF